MSSDVVKPTLRDGTVDRFISALRAHLYEENADFLKTCLTCVCFDEKLEYCKKYKARPPARVIAYGCRDYFHNDEIPF